MEKKFKNKIAVTGSIALRKAFRDELFSLGYTWIAGNKDDFDFYPYLCTGWQGVSNGLGNGANIHLGKRIELSLPADWNKAIQLASEVEEEVLEYVRCTRTNSGYFIEDLIYKVINAKDLMNAKLICNIPSNNHPVGKLLYAILDGKDGKYYKPSTKAEYDAQELEFKKKELLEEAKRRYTINTKFKCLVTQSIYIIPLNTTFKIDEHLNIYSYVNHDLFHKHYSLEKSWATIIEDEFKVGDYITITKSSINWDDNMDDYVGKTVKITEITASKEDKVHFENDGKWTWKYNQKHFRRATPEEVTKYNNSKENTIEIAGYKAEVKNYRIAFGCKEFTAEDLKAIKRVNELSKLKSIDFNFNGADTILVYDDEEYTVSDKVLDKLIDKCPQF